MERMAPTPRPLEDRLWEKVIRRGEEECWLWTGTTAGDGYGRISVSNGKVTVVHRLAYQLLIGPIPEGMTLDHLCRVRHCVNPRHLEPVTNGENVLRGESLAAQNARKTKCLRGHPFTEENTYTDIYRGRPRRRCRACARLRDRARSPRRKSQ